MDNVELLDGNRTVTDPREVSEKFNDYFSSVAQKLAAEIPQVNADPLDYVRRQQNTFLFFNTDVGGFREV